MAVMRERFEAVIRAATNRRVVGFMSGNQQSPDMICEVFVLGPADDGAAGGAKPASEERRVTN